MTSHAAISRMRCANLLAQVSDDAIAAVEAVLAVIVAGQVRQNDSPECDGSLPSPDANRTAPNTLADRDCDGTSAPSCREIGATSSGRVAGQQTPGTSTAKTSRDNAPVAAGEASSAESKGTRMFKVGDCIVITGGRWMGAIGYVTERLEGHLFMADLRHEYRGDREGKVLDDVEVVPFSIQAHEAALARDCELVAKYDANGTFPDFDLDAATCEVRTDIAEADCIALEALTGPGVPDWQPVPGEQVEVVEAVGSRTGERVAIGTFRGEEADAGPAGGVWQLVEVYGVVRRFRAVGRVG